MVSNIFHIFCLLALCTALTPLQSQQKSNKHDNVPNSIQQDSPTQQSFGLNPPSPPAKPPSILEVLADFVIGPKVSTISPSDLLEEQLKTLEEDLMKVEQQEMELRQRKKELDRFVLQVSQLPDDSPEHNFAVEQLVETELERLDTLEWRLNRIRKRLVAQLHSQ